MNGDRIRELREALGWSQRDLAGRLGFKTHTPVKQWENNQSTAPAAVMAWLERSASALMEQPLPQGWVVRSDIL